ncbi:MAG: (d)CMP kinase [Eubacteriales bacterium]|nr:(d)CMP kinase [Eubacteriales bacterium]
MGFNIAVDGPAGAGKSTIAKRAAQELSFIYVDTGAMYRAIALYFLRHHVCVEHPEEVENACDQIQIAIRYENQEQQVFLNGENVTAFLRTEEVGNMASVSSAKPAVRAKLLNLQREIAQKENVLMDGRDIGSNVLPGAELKIYLTASVQTRAERRYQELKEKGIACNLEEIKKDIEERDYRDMNRDVSPLVKTEDAVLIDSSNMTIDQVVESILNLYQERRHSL